MMSISRLFGAAFLCLGVFAQTAAAQDGHKTLGLTSFFANDGICDGIVKFPSDGANDRWRSAGFGVHAVRGESWSGSLPMLPFEIIEYRFRLEVMAPDNLRRPDSDDRLFAGSLWAGAHTHLAWRGFEVTAGADLVITGEQSGVRRLQANIYDWLGDSEVNVEDHQVDDGIYLHGTGELAKTMALGWGELRPFFEVQAGVENLLRVGADLTVGGLGQGGLRIREPITGQRIASISTIADGGWSFLAGADVAFVARSIFLPESRGYTVEPMRYRLRAGANYGFANRNLFYGLTYMSEEFSIQTEGQFLGTVSLMRRF